MQPINQHYKTKVFKGNYARVMMQINAFQKTNHIIDSCTSVTLNGKLAVILFYKPLSFIRKHELTPDRELCLSLAQEAYKRTMQLDRLIVG